MLLTIPSTIMDILLTFSSCFTQPTFENFAILAVGAIMTNGPRTVTNVLRAIKPLIRKQFGAYHRFLNRAQYSLFALSKMLCCLIFSFIPGTIELLVDETISRHSGKDVYGKSAHRDKIRSTKKRVCYAFGHYWVVLCVNIHMPFLKRPWALPIMSLLWMSEKECEKHHIHHRTPIELTIIMLRKICSWFPHTYFIITGDGGFASLKLSQFCKKHPQLQLVSRLRKDAKIYGPPPKKKTKKRGRPPQKGKRIASPQDEVKNKKRNKHKWRTATVTWYGGKPKCIEYFYNTGLLYQPGKGTVVIAYVIIFDPEDGAFETLYTTDLSLDPCEIIRLFVERWSIEVTFEEARKFLRIESTRNRKKESVTRSFPLLLGLFSIISIWYFHTVKDHAHEITQEEWYVKEQPTFVDAINAVRNELWEKSISSISIKKHNMIEIPVPIFAFMTKCLARAA